MRPSMPREKKPERIGHAQDHPAPVGLQREQRVGVRAVRERDVHPESQRVEAIDEVVVLHVDGDIASARP